MAVRLFPRRAELAAALAEIEALKRRHEEQRKEDADERSRLKGQAGIHRKHHEDLRRVLQQKDAEIDDLRKSTLKLQQMVDQLENERYQNLLEIAGRI